MKKTRKTHNGEPVYVDDKGRMFVKYGKAHVYLNEFNNKPVRKKQ